VKATVFLYCLVFSFALFGQRQKFYDQIERTECDPIALRAAENAEVDILDFDQQYYAGMIIHELNQKRKSHGRSGFKVDSTFNRICNTGVKHFSRGSFSNRKRQRWITKHSEFGIRYLRGNFRMYKSYSFYFNLTNLGNRTNFYYVAGDETTRLKLFVGKRPRTTSPTHQDYVEPTPVKPITELQFKTAIIQQLMRKDGSTEFYSKNYSHIGISMRLDEYSVNRRKIPRAYIMIIIGGKQTQKVREARPIPENNAVDNTPYTILK
jgi:hypothetical protein